MVYRCKICGGALDATGAQSVVTCEYCGTQQTLPSASSEHIATLYERADHFRRNNDFDKAIGIYEQILNEDNTDAEAYWSLVLCRYGIEYVEDPKSNKRIATVNRMQYTSVLADEDYKSAIKYASIAQRSIYEAEAKEIDGIQKGILAISQKEEPFDVFICYKETDNNGRRTPDSVLANELYHQLTNEGFKVFYSRITLEDKLGTAYEPYIFAALNSAKVMVVLGTKPDYFNAVWVKNEWSRFLTLTKGGAEKVLIPAYRDMDPYDLPEEFSHLQAQDMSKLGFMQDLIRGITKLTKGSKPKAVKEPTASVNGNVAPLLRRAFIFLEDGNWESADEYCEKVLDLDPECGEAYLGKMMVDLKVSRREKLGELSEPFEDNANYKKALRFGSAALQDELNGYNNAIREKIERNKLLAIYKNAEAVMNGAASKSDYLRASELFLSIGGFRNSSARAQECKDKAELTEKAEIYAAAVALIEKNNAKSKNSASEADYLRASELFLSIDGFRDAADRAEECKSKAEECKIKASELKYDALYQAAAALMRNAKKEADFRAAEKEFLKIKEYKNSEKLASECKEKAEIARKTAIYTAAIALMTGDGVKNYQKAITELEKIPDFKDSSTRINQCKHKIEEIHASILAAQVARQKRAEQRSENFKKKIPIIKKVSFIVVPILILAILAASIVPNIDWSKPQKPGGTTKNELNGEPATSEPETSASDTTDEVTTDSQTTITDTTDEITTDSQTTITDTTESVTTKPQTTKPQQTKPQTTKPTQTTEPPTTPDTVTHADGCPFAGTTTSEFGELIWCQVDANFITHLSSGQGSDGPCRWYIEYTLNKRLARKSEQYFFDEDCNNLSKEISTHYHENGNVQYLIQVEYYASGNQKLQAWKTYDESGNFKVETRDEYSASGARVHTQIDSDGGKVSYEYDKNGNMIQDITYNGDGSIYSWNAHEYDSKGRYIKSTTYDANGSIESWETYSYDDVKNTTKTSYYRSNGVIYYYQVYDNNTSRDLTYVRYNDDGTVKDRSEYEYDSSGRLIKRYDYLGYDRLSCVTENDYVNKIQRTTYYKEDGSVDSTNESPLIQN